MTSRAPSPALAPGHATLKLASYQKPITTVVERRAEGERRKDAVRALGGERRTASQRVLRALFGT